MCGIAGILKFRGGSPDRDVLGRMVSVLTHRGPDGNGFYAAGPVALAHARLSIIDLDGGRQPMSTADGRFWITFNGEIFNYLELREELIAKGHQFATRSDTEVILHLFQEEGERCVERLNGQWGFAIWDTLRQSLFLSRDRVGVRPLFYTQTQDSFLFASEIKALFTSPEVSRGLDLQALDQIFTFWVTLPPRTAFQGISQLPPGHSMIVENGSVRVWQYWNFSYAPENASDRSEDKLADELLDLLRDAARIRLRADVPVGAYLSGGLDSTIITALTQNLVGDRLKTFSVSFDDAEFDESGYQKQASEFLGTQHRDVRCSYDDIASIFPQVVRHAEMPLLRTAPAPLFLLSRLVRESGFKVVLTGEGADEMLGGYDIFKETKIRQFWARNLDSKMRPQLLKRLYPYMDNLQRQPLPYLKSFFHVSESDLASPFFSHLPRWELTAKLKVFFSHATKQEIASYSGLADMAESLPAAYQGWNSFNRAEYLEATHLLPGYILSSQGDRMAMANSVEGRYPFLDHRVVEFAAKLSPQMKMKVLNQKHLLKRAGRGLVPSSILTRHKQPYRAPDGKSLLGKMGTYVEDMLSEERVRRDGVFDSRSVSSLLAKFKAGRASSVKDNMALVGILSTEILLDAFVHQTQVERRLTAEPVELANSQMHPAHA